MSDALPLLINQVDILIVGSVYQALRIHIISKCNQAPSNRSSGQIVINSAADWKNISIFDIDILTECEAFRTAVFIGFCPFGIADSLFV